MSTSLKTLRRRISQRIKEPFFADIPDGYFNPASGSTTTVIRSDLSALWTTADRWKDSWLYCASGTDAGKERRITDYSETTGYITVAPGFPNTPQTTDEFEIHSRCSGTAKVNAINAALDDAWPQFFDAQTVEIAMCKNVVELTSAEGFPTTWRELLEIWVEPLERNQTGEYTATSATASTITVTGAAWTTNEHTGKTVSLIDGTGKSQERTVSSNTSDTLTVSTNWTTTPDSTTVFVIKTKRDQGVWLKLDEGKVVLADSLVSGVLLPRWLQFWPGRTLRLYGLTAPATLTSETDTTDVPAEFLIWSAIANIGIGMGWEAPSRNWDAEQFIGRFAQQQADLLRHRLAWPHPAKTVWSPPSRARLYPQEDPLGWSDG